MHCIATGRGWVHRRKLSRGQMKSDLEEVHSSHRRKLSIGQMSDLEEVHSPHRRKLSRADEEGRFALSYKPEMSSPREHTQTHLYNLGIYS